jgi:hypothetical protein
MDIIIRSTSAPRAAITETTTMIELGGVRVLVEVANIGAADLDTVTVTAALKNDVCDIINEALVVAGPLAPGRTAKLTFKLGLGPMDFVFVELGVTHAALRVPGV